MSEHRRAPEGSSAPVETQVAQLYEDHPYPNHGVISSVVAKMLEPSLRAIQNRTGTRRLRVVDLGCGTGEQTCGIARAFPECDVMGADRSGASIAVARKLAADNRLTAKFAQVDLLGDLGALGRPDVVVVIGVLHHMPEADIVLQRLRTLTPDSGLLLGMVYGRFGHAERIRIVEVLDILAPEGSRKERLELLSEGRIATNSGPAHYVNALARRARLGPDISPVEAVRRFVGGRSAAYQADYYTHPREGVMTWAEVASLLEDNGWRFGGWPRRSGMPDRPEQVVHGRTAEILRGMPLLSQASVYERIVAPFLLYFLAHPS